MAEGKPIIVIKKKGGHGGHHGGAWKVAYADFVTAMMAFFMVMWLVNSAETNQKKNIASYFRRPGLFEHGSGTPLMIGEAGILNDAYAPAQKKEKPSYSSGEEQQIMKKKTGAEDANKDEQITKSKGEQVDKLIVMGEIPKKQGNRGATQQNEGAVGGLGEKNSFADVPKSDDTQKSHPPSSAQSTTGAQALQEKLLLEEVKAKLEAEMVKSPELKELLGLVEVKLEADGLKIEIADTEKTSMFALGSARILPEAYTAFETIANVIKKLPNSIDIIGHTDAKPFASRAGGYSNWELSGDRANAARRLLEQQGIPADRFSGVIGRADQELKLSNDPLHPSNRRITLKVRFQTKFPDDLVRDPNFFDEVSQPKSPPGTPRTSELAAPDTPIPPPEGTAVETTTESSSPSPKGPQFGTEVGAAGYKPKSVVQAKKRAKNRIILPDGTESSSAGNDLIFEKSPVLGPGDILLGTR